MKKKLVLVVVLALAIFAGKYVYDMHINHNFETITEHKVYKSGVIPPDELPEYVKKYKIKSIIDLRFPGTGDDVKSLHLHSEAFVGFPPKTPIKAAGPSLSLPATAIVLTSLNLGLNE